MRRRNWLAAIGRAAGGIALGVSAPACAGTGVDLFSPETFLFVGDLRLAAVNGEQSWIHGGFGKLRFGGRYPYETSSGLLRAALGSADLVWQPKLGWALSGTVVGTIQQSHRLEAGLSEAYLSFKPLGGGRVRFSARAGLMWPRVSLEHSGPEWAVRDTITPSAINSWIGEEVKFVGAEGTASTGFGGGKLSATAAIIDANDTAGALLAFRGWTLDDIKALAYRKLPLPPLNDEIEEYQPRYSYPVANIGGGFLKRPGWYARIAWELRAPVRIEAIHYTNGGDPEAANANLEWGWRTWFNNVGLVAQLTPQTELRAQAISGRSQMGPVEDGRRWIDLRFRSGFVLVTRRFGQATSLSARVEAFGTRNRGEYVTSEDDERGWAVTGAGKRALGQNLTALVELLHVDSRRAARTRVGLAPHQVQTQLQGSLRLRW